MVFFCDCREDIVEAADVSLAIVARKSDAGDYHLGMGVLQGMDDGVEVSLHFFGPDSAQAVVAAKSDDDDGGMKVKDFIDAVDAVFGGVATNAFVDDMVVISAGV